MKILFVSDTHGEEINEKLIKKVDLILHSGDFTVFEDRIVELLLYLESLPVPIFLIHGNHESEENVKKIIKQYNLRNIAFLHNKIVKFKGLIIGGIGGGGFSYGSPSTKKLEKKLKNKHIDILLTHAPPYNTKLDQLGMDHIGNIEFRNFIEMFQPRICSCGHLHENAGKEDKINNTLLINPGYKGKILEF